MSAPDPFRANSSAFYATASRTGGVISLAFGLDSNSPDALAAAIAEEGAAMSTMGEALTGSEATHRHHVRNTVGARSCCDRSRPVPTDRIPWGEDSSSSYGTLSRSE